MGQEGLLKKNRDEFKSVLDFILNRCDIRQLDAVEEAVKRRKKSLEVGVGLSSLNPAKMASEMSATINASIASSVDGMTASIRDYALQIIEKEAPELSLAQREELLQAWIPRHRMTRHSKTGAKTGTNCRKSLRGKVSLKVVESMSLQFVADCLGELDTETASELEKELPNWRKSYWANFPSEIQALIQSRLSGDISDVEFKATLSVLCSE